MDETAKVLVHESAFPGELGTQLVAGLRSKRVDQKFLYLGWKQTRTWLALHEAHSPARTDSGTLAIYEDAFTAAGKEMPGSILHLVGLAPGGGQKEGRGLEVLRGQGKTVFFTPCDLSLELALTAHQEATGRLRGLQSNPVLCDLPRCTTLPALLKDVDPGGTQRLVTFFGTFHNFEPGEILPRLLNAVRSQDTLLLSANLAPENGYEEALKRILLQYRNPLGNEWIMGFLDDLGIGRGVGEVEFAIGSGEISELQRIEARFVVRERVEVIAHGTRVEFSPGERLQMFFSYRYTERHLGEALKKHGLRLLQKWISTSGEEGVFMCRRESRPNGA